MTSSPIASDASGAPKSGSDTSSSNKRKLWTTIPGFAISAFFLWRTLRVIPYQTLRSIHIAHAGWIPVLLLFMVAGYTTRIYRWWLMLRSSGAPKFAVCGRVLLTSFAANNVLPFRIGDFLRVFAYADDLGASSSTVLSTVILERLLDVFTLVAFLVLALLGSSAQMPPLHIFGHQVAILRFALPVLAAASLGLIVFLFGATLVDRLLRQVMGRLSTGPLLAKIEKWLLLGFDAVKKMTFSGKLMLLITSAIIWFAEGMIFVSAARLLDITVGSRGPWLALSLSNLSYLIPSSPGAIGTFEYFAKLGMVTQGAPQGISALYGLLVHMIVLFVVTGVGGIAFLMHRARRVPHPTFTEDLQALPAEMPYPSQDTLRSSDRQKAK